MAIRLAYFTVEVSLTIYLFDRDDPFKSTCVGDPLRSGICKWEATYFWIKQRQLATDKYKIKSNDILLM